VCAYDPAPERRELALKKGIELAEDVAEVGRRTDHLVACVVRTLDQTESVLFGSDGALSAAPDRVGIVMSSIGADGISRLEAQAMSSRVRIVDAPILGNARSAETGTLTLVISGAGRDKAEARFLLEDISGLIVDVGERLGAAQAMKMTSQLLQIVGMLATFEGIELAERHGVPRAAALDLLKATAPSWTTSNWLYASDLWARRDPTTSLGLFAKDLAAAVTDARDVELSLPMTELALELVQRRLAGGRAVRG
jgi:3-hydroxyisobutyrate dehydrogenase